MSMMSPLKWFERIRDLREREREKERKREEYLVSAVGMCGLEMFESQLILSKET
jgi:hypothetical protein